MSPLRQSRDCGSDIVSVKMFQEWRGDKCYIQNIWLQSLSFSVSQGCEVCSIKSCSNKLSEQPACISPLHLLAAWERESLSSLPHRDNNFRYQRAKQKKGDGGILKYTKSYAPSLVNSKQMMLTLLFTASRLWAQIHQVFCISGFALFPPEENSIRADLWVCINDNPPLLPPHIGEGTHQRISNAPLCLFINNIWPKSALTSFFCNLPWWRSHKDVSQLLHQNLRWHFR